MKFKMDKLRDSIDLYVQFKNGSGSFVDSFKSVQEINKFIENLSKQQFELPFEEQKKYKINCTSTLIEEYLEAIEDCTEDDEKYDIISEELKNIINPMWIKSKHSDLDRGSDSFKFYISTTDKKVYEADIYSIKVVIYEVSFMEDFDFSIYPNNK